MSLDKAGSQNKAGHHKSFQGEKMSKSLKGSPAKDTMFAVEVGKLIDNMINFSENIAKTNVDNSDNPKSHTGVKKVMKKIVRSLVLFTAGQDSGSLLDNQDFKALKDASKDITLALIGFKFVLEEEYQQSLATTMTRMAIMRIEKLIALINYEKDEKNEQSRGGRKSAYSNLALRVKVLEEKANRKVHFVKDMKEMKKLEEH